MDENKANLTHFLSNELEKILLNYGHEIGISGGFKDPEKVSSVAVIDVPQLQASY